MEMEEGRDGSGRRKGWKMEEGMEKGVHVEIKRENNE